MKDFICKALSESNGNPSSARLNVFIAVLILIPSVAFTLIYVTLEKPEMIASTLTTVVALVASMLGLKVLQKGKENAK